MPQHCIAEKVRTVRKYRSRPLCEWGDGEGALPGLGGHCWGGPHGPEPAVLALRDGDVARASSHLLSMSLHP